MNKALIALPLIFFLIHSANAQDCNVDFLGTKTLYKNNSPQYIPAPAGYEPVFINYVGRHGARHLTKDVKASSAFLLLMKADSLNLLTEKGKKLEQMVIALQKVEKDNTKNISGEGRTELHGIGERTFNNYPTVFKASNNIEIAVTKEVRTDQSADAFLKGLKSKLKDSASIKKYNDDVHLRFYDLSPAYKQFESSVDGGELKSSLDKNEQLPQLSNNFASQFFNEAILSGLDDKAKRKFTSDIFGFATIVYSLAEEIKSAGYQPADLDFKSFFTCDQLTKLGLLDSIDENLKKGPGTDNNGIQVRIAVPLLVDFINKADAFVDNKKVNAQLRFTHAEAIAPFAALLQISGASQSTTDASKLNSVWKSSNVICLSSNIQWVFYKKAGTEGYLVKVLLNEKEVAITGLKGGFPFYKWSDLRAFYLKKLTGLQVKLTDDMKGYLVNLK